jgi:hypothetical protein
MDNRKETKISLAEGLIAGFWFFFLPDLIELILIIFALDDFWISDIYAFSSSQMYLALKGIKPTYALVTNLLECIPWIGALPLRTIGFIITFWIENHPEIKQKIDVASKATPQQQIKSK